MAAIAFTNRTKIAQCLLDYSKTYVNKLIYATKENIWT